MLSRSRRDGPIFPYLFSPAPGSSITTTRCHRVSRWELPHTDEDAQLAATMASMWVAFAASGDPSIDGVRWPRYSDAADGPYLRLDVAQSGRGITAENGFMAAAWPLFSKWSQEVLRE